VHTEATKKKSVRIAGRNYEQTKTTVSMSAATYAKFVAGFGSKKAFRRAFNNILSYAEPDDGFPLSAVVRIGLEAMLAAQQKAAQTAAADE